MASPFPGMDPYLEYSEIWPGFHHYLADEFVTQLNPQIGPKYYADVHVRVVMEEIQLAKTHVIYADTAIIERTPVAPAPSGSYAGAIAPILEAPVQRIVQIPIETKLRAVRIYSTEFGDLVTSVEMLSPVNKRRGPGLNQYQRKRKRLLQSPVHLVEIDLLRGGQRPGLEVQTPPLDTDYILLVNRADDSQTRTSQIWPVALNEPLPVIPIPLLEPDPDVLLDLRAALDHLYERAGYGWRIDYCQPVPPPALRPSMAIWLKEHLP